MSKKTPALNTIEEVNSALAWGTSRAAEYDPIEIPEDATWPSKWPSSPQGGSSFDVPLGEVTEQQARVARAVVQEQQRRAAPAVRVLTEDGVVLWERTDAIGFAARMRRRREARRSLL